MPSTSRAATVGIVFLCAVSGAAAGVSAQAMVAPPGLASVEGLSSNPFLFGRKNEVRIMDVYDAAALPFRSPFMITGVKLRMDQRNNTRTYAKKRNIFLALEVSTSHATASSVSKGFDGFHGVDRSFVYNGRLDMPLQAQPATPQTPRPFNIPIAFSRPWAYTLTPVRRGSAAPSTLVLDYRIYDKVTSSEYVLDMAGFCRHKPTQFGLGAKCLGSNGKQIQLTVNDTVYAGSWLTYTIQGVIPTNTITLALRAGPLGNPVPREIDPGSGCYMNFDPMMMTTTVASSTGTGTFRFPIPRGPENVDLEIHAQAAGFDINANAALHVTSFGLSTKICGPYPVCQLMQLNGGAASATIAQSNVYGLAHAISFY